MSMVPSDRGVGQTHPYDRQEPYITQPTDLTEPCWLIVQISICAIQVTSNFLITLLISQAGF